MKNLDDKKIGVLMGGLSSEREISLSTGNSVCDAITRMELNVIPIDADRNVANNLQNIDLAFIALHGTYGEDGCIQGLLEYLKIPYTGSGVTGSALAYDKLKAKEILKFHGIPTADHEVFYKSQKETIQRKLELPVVVKPTNQGSSFGVSIVTEENQWKPALENAFQYSEEIIVEKFIEGKLLAIGMNGEEPMPIVHIRPKSGFYDYEAKYTSGKTEYICPSDLSKSEVNNCNEVSRKVFKVLRGRGIPRVDIILDENGTPYVLEMNTIPGMTPTSLLPMAALEMGMDFDQLVMEILKTAQLDNGDTV
ncbi:MAG: D-alanine--D-alanine ligase [Nitrospinae bacterium]|nr:D-alanine--D-alanine ligase [Nitrospinota bacterium]